MIFIIDYDRLISFSFQILSCFRHCTWLTSSFHTLWLCHVHNQSIRFLSTSILFNKSSLYILHVRAHCSLHKYTYGINFTFLYASVLVLYIFAVYYFKAIFIFDIRRSLTTSYLPFCQCLLPLFPSLKVPSCIQTLFSSMLRLGLLMTIEINMFVSTLLMIFIS